MRAPGCLLDGRRNGDCLLGLRSTAIYVKQKGHWLHTNYQQTPLE